MKYKTNKKIWLVVLLMTIGLVGITSSNTVFAQKKATLTKQGNERYTRGKTPATPQPAQGVKSKGREGKKSNLSSFTPNRYYKNYEIAYQYNSGEYRSNPDFGTLPVIANDGFFEVLKKRTATERFFRNVNDTNDFYITKSLNPINYKKEGYWRAISSNLRPQGGGSYTASQQPFPTSLNTNKKRSGLKIGGNTLYFNDASLWVKYKNQTTKTYAANWSNYTVGDDGIYITEVFPGIDMKIVYQQGGVKSTYIVKHKLPTIAQAKLIDQLDFSKDVLPIFPYIGDTVNGKFFGEIGIGGTKENPTFLYKRNMVYDQSTSKTFLTLPYEWDNTAHNIALVMNKNVLNNDTLTYPVIIDPLVTVGPVYATGYVFSIDPMPSYCSRSLTLNFPANAEPTDFSTYWQLSTGYDCWNYPPSYYGWVSDAQVWITSSCGAKTPTAGPTGAPNTGDTYWTCVAPCNVSGTWYPTLPFGLGEEQMVTCYTPSCSTIPMQFTYNITGQGVLVDCYCSQYGYYGIWKADIVVDTWWVQVRGHTLELQDPNPQASGNGGSATMTPATCAGGNITLGDPNPQYGVSPYSYSWSTGATSNSISIAPTPYNGQTIQVVVTDNCGVSRTASYLIQCPLGVSFIDFYAENLGKKVLLKWSTATETENDYYRILRSEDGEKWQEIGKVEGGGNSTQVLHYNFKDKRPLSGISYYQLGIVDFDGNVEYTEVKTIQRQGNGQTIRLIPNPARTTVAIAFDFPQKAVYTVKIVNALGKTQFLSQKTFQEGLQTLNVNTSGFASGVYSVVVLTKNNVNTARLVIE